MHIVCSISHLPSGMMAAADKFVCERARGLRIAEPFRSLFDTRPSSLAVSYAGRRPSLDAKLLTELLSEPAQRFFLAGVDLMCLGDDHSSRFVVIEINSAPGFAYCTPGRDAWDYAYSRTADLLLTRMPQAEWRDIAFLTESKIPIETAGFQAVLKERTGYPIPVFSPADLRAASRVACGDRLRLSVSERPLRGGIRYLHTAPWDLLPPNVEGTFVNGTDVDLAGGRDKIAAHHAFMIFNATFEQSGLSVDTPRTRVVDHGGAHEAAGQRLIVRKIPHGNSGIGVDFVDPASPAVYPHLEQQLLLPPGHEVDDTPPLRPLVVGGERYVYDLRVVIGATLTGFAPLMVYARRAKRPLSELHVVEPTTLDDFLKVNIAHSAGGRIVLDEERLILPDRDGAECLGLTTEDLTDAVVQSMVATVAVDRFGVASPRRADV